MAIIGASNMDYLGRARKPSFKTNINGTHTLTFEMPDKYFDSKIGDYVHNELVDTLFPECKIKYHYKNKWYEFYIKSVSDAKKFKSYMRTYTCQDSFIDELSRNGYGITFDEELYNNVEEIGAFSNEILKDSVWEYDSHLNWGDFTEFTSEKLFKIPLSLFNNKLIAHKVNYNISETAEILNIFTNETRQAEISDDIAREKSQFWDEYQTKNNPLLTVNVEITNKDNDYIYVPYSQLGFCYVSSDQEGDNGLEEAFAATEYPAEYIDVDNKGYCIAPTTVDPNQIIQFMYIPKNEKIEVDEAGLILNKNFTYVMTVAEWNKQLQTKWFYKFEDYKENGFKKKVLVNSWTDRDYIYGNKVAYYDGYLSEIEELISNNDVNVNIADMSTLNQLDIYGKKIVISDRTELNISEDIDQYVTVYNNTADEYKDLYINDKWIFDETKDSDYRVCSKIATREIIPQLARNFIQNGKAISSILGWEIMSSLVTSTKNTNGEIQLCCLEVENKIPVPNENYSIDVKQTQESYITFVPAYQDIEELLNKEVNKLLESIEDINTRGLVHPSQPLLANQYKTGFFLYDYSKSGDWLKLSNEDKERIITTVDTINQLTRLRFEQYSSGIEYATESTTTLSEVNAVVNFGAVGQERIISKDKTYCLGITLRALSDYTKEKISYDNNIQEGELANSFIRIGTGKLVYDGDYIFDKYFDIPLKYFQNGDIYNGYLLIKPDESYENVFIAIYSNASYELINFEFFECYTKGIDQFNNGFFRYSGRNLFNSYTPIKGDKYNYSDLYTKEDIEKYILFEDDIMPGDIYEYRQYFIQKLKIKVNDKSYDTFMAKSYLDENAEIDSETLPLSSAQYTEDDYEIITNYIDLNNCPNYNGAASATDFDCNYNNENHVCLYQKYGYCPYRFQTEKHCRKVRTIKAEKSNRFNLTQELGKTFNLYPIYYIAHHENGKILTQQDSANSGTRVITPGRENWMDKRIFYITEKGSENKIGFRYEKNLENISRTINSNQIVSKLYVLDVDSGISKTGLCTIKTAEDNPSKDNFIIDFSYYIQQGLLDKDRTLSDLYGNNSNDLGYLKTLGYLNIEYDKLSNYIINLSAASFTDLQAKLDVNLTGIETAQKRLRELEKIMSKYTKKYNTSYVESDAYKSYQYQYIEQNAIYVQLIQETFYTNGISIYGTISDCAPADFLKTMSIDDVKERWVDTHDYDYGLLGQFNKEYNQIKEWTREQASYLKRINKLSQEFYRKYEPYLKEGTWSDGNFITDNAYYLKAIEVAKEGAIPKVSYTMSVVDIEPIYQQGDYIYEPADTTYIEDIGMFGVNPKTGLPNRLKVIVSGVIEEPDEPKNNKIEVQNFTTQFQDLFQQVTATVQSLSFNENIYKRSSNFTSLQNIERESLQGTLDNNDLTLVNTGEKNIQIDNTGQSGSDINNHSNKYKLNGQGLFFSNNGGQSWNVGVGPNGINADYIKAGTLDAGKIRIVDSNYLYFSWDKNGIVAYRDPKTAASAQAFQDYAAFNKYGLSLVEGGNIKLRAGYAFNSNNGTGDAKTEKEISVDSPIGFYLYNSAGKAIFATESSSSTEAAKETARINLIGEMLVTNDAEVSNFYGYLYGGANYIESVIEYYSIGDDSKNISSINATISGTEATYTRDASFKLDRNECAAAIAYFYKNQSLTKITIVDGGENYDYLNPNVIESNTDLWGSITHGTENRYCKFRYNTVAFSNISINFIILQNGIFNPRSSLGSALTKNALTTGSGTNSSKIKLSATTAKGVFLSELFQADYVYYKETTISTCYKIDNIYYTQLLGEEVSTNNGSVSLYLNNRTDLASSSDSSSRLFVCCNSQKDKNVVYNIFSILKDGSLHMGGTIKNVTDSTKLPDQIQLNNDEYLIIKDGQLQLSFDSIVDTATQESIVTYISSQLRQSSSDIIDDVTGRYHNHYIQESYVYWNRPRSMVIDGTEVNFSNITISINANEHGYTMNLQTLLNNIGYYNDLYWGDAYTNSSSI